jgi:hypothetical protein
MPYISLVAQMAAVGHPVVAFENHHLGMRWTDYIPEADEVVQRLVEVLQRHGITRCAVAVSAL